MKKKLAVFVEPETVRQLKIAAAKLGMNMSELVEKLIKDFVGTSGESENKFQALSR